MKTNHSKTARLRLPSEDTSLSLNLMSGFIQWLECCKDILSSVSDSQTKSPGIPPLFQKSWTRIIDSVLTIATTINRQTSRRYVDTSKDLLDKLGTMVAKFDRVSRQNQLIRRRHRR